MLPVICDLSLRILQVGACVTPLRKIADNIVFILFVDVQFIYLFNTFKRSFFILFNLNLGKGYNDSHGIWYAKGFAGEKSI